MWVEWVFWALPWLPGVMFVMVVIAALAATRVAHRLGVSSLQAFTLLASTGLVLAATIPPDGSPIRVGTTSCDLGRVWLASWRTYVSINQASLNVALFVPMGVAIGLLPRKRTSRCVLAVAVILPFLIELIQLGLPVLGRGCQSADVVDNLFGLGLGLVAGIAVRATAARWTGRRSPT
ncbi:MAG: VanZ family protein [Chloroflexota bacterium]